MWFFPPHPSVSACAADQMLMVSLATALWYASRPLRASVMEDSSGEMTDPTAHVQARPLVFTSLSTSRPGLVVGCLWPSPQMSDTAVLHLDTGEEESVNRAEKGPAAAESILEFFLPPGVLGELECKDRETGSVYYAIVPSPRFLTTPGDVPGVTRLRCEPHLGDFPLTETVPPTIRWWNGSEPVGTRVFEDLGVTRLTLNTVGGRRADIDPFSGDLITPSEDLESHCVSCQLSGLHFVSHVGQRCWSVGALPDTVPLRTSYRSHCDCIATALRLGIVVGVASATLVLIALVYRAQLKRPLSCGGDDEINLDRNRLPLQNLLRVQEPPHEPNRSLSQSWIPIRRITGPRDDPARGGRTRIIELEESSV